MHRGSGKTVLITALAMLTASAALVLTLLDPQPTDPIDPPGEEALLLVGSVGLALSLASVFLALRLGRDARARTALTILGVIAVPIMGPLAMLMLKALHHYSQHSQAPRAPDSRGHGGRRELTPITLLLLPVRLP